MAGRPLTTIETDNANPANKETSESIPATAPRPKYPPSLIPMPPTVIGIVENMAITGVISAIYNAV